jgi:hypothetical protein
MGSNQAFNFRKTLNQGDIVQFQVGTDYKTGAAVGLDVDVALVEVTSWNAYTDFYFDSTSNSNNVGSWTGAKSPSPAGKAWGYYIANANANGFPDRIGDYFPPGNDLSLKQALYAMANHKPLGVGQQQAGGFSGANDAWYSTGGKGTSVYEDRYGHGSQIGSFDVPWYEGAPACPSGGIWMRAGYLGNTGAEGICPVVTWTAPYPGIYKFQGSFVAGTDGSGASVAVVDSTGGVPLLARTALTPGNSQAFVFTKILNPGDVIQFQVGSDYKADAPVGLNVIVSRIQQNFNAFGEFWMSGRMISPVPDGLSDGGPAAWSNIVDATIQGRSPNTPTYPNAWSYGVINCTGGTPSANDFQPTSITGENPEGMIYRAAWQQFFSLEDGVTGIYAAGVPLWSYQSSGAQVGWYGSAWYFDAPGNDGNGAGRNGLSTAPNSNKKYLWMKVGPGASDGVAPVVRWTAPANGTYRFKGEFLPGGNGAGTMSTAVLTYNNPDLELGTEIVLDRQITTHDGDVRSFDFNLTVVGGQTVSWVVGADGDATGDVMGLQAEVSPVKTSLTLSGVSVANKTYNGNNSATLQGTPTLVGISPGDDVSLMNVVAIFDSPDVGSRNVSIAADLAGADASKYSLTLPTGITGTIDKATPTISSAPTASPITQGETLASSILSGGTASVAGAFAWTTSSTIPLSTASYSVTFTPTDGANYNTATTSVSVTVNSAAPTGASFTSWRGSSPASAALLQNYAFGAASPSSTLSQSSLPSSAVVSGKLVLTYYVRQEATNPNLVVPQLSTDLASPGNWADLGSSSIATISTDTVDGVQVVKKTASVPVDSTPRKFLRLKIQE